MDGSADAVGTMATAIAKMTQGDLLTGPTFVVAGAARSGTTALVEGLRAHPDVFITHPKEPHYFAFAGQEVSFTGPGDHDTVNKAAVTDRAAYLAMFAGQEPYAARGDGSVSTLYYHDHAVDAINALNPDMRVLIVLRNPVERAYSSFQYLRSRGLEPLDDFHEALDDEARRIDAGWHHLWHYRAMGMYADAVKHFFDAFGRDQVKVWFYDDFAEDGAGVLGEACTFIGVDPNRLVGQAVPQINASGEPRSKRLQSMMGRVSRNGVARTTVKSVVPFVVRERIRQANLSASSVPDPVNRRLEGAYHEDLRELADVLGRALPAGWSS